MSVYQNTKSGKWFCVFRYRDYQGQNKQVKKSGFAKKRDAQQYELDFKRKMEGSSDMSFEALAELYLNDIKDSAKSYIHRRNIIRLAILPFFGKMLASQITPASVRQWRNEKLFPHYAEVTSRIYNTMLSTIFNFGVQFYNLPGNPVHHAGKFKYPNHEVEEESTSLKIWTKEQFEDFLTRVDSADERMALLILFYTGVRRGECMGLRCKDIDLKARVLHIVQNRVCYNEIGVRIQTLKTKSSLRDVTIPNFLANELRKYIKTMKENSSDTLLFGELPPNKLTVKFAAKQKKHKIEPRIRLHDLRHSHASLLIELGFSPQAIADRLGHKNTSMVMQVYGHLYPRQRDRIAGELDKLCT